MNNNSMNLRRMTTNAILIAIGAILHYITPPIPLLGVPMQPDLSLVMLFTIMIYNKDYKTDLICGIAVGIFAAATTKMGAPGQISNIVDKFITTNIMFVIISALRNRINVNKLMIMIIPFGTTISGIIFVSVAILVGGIKLGAFLGMVLTVVLPAAVINTVLGFVLFKVVQKTALTAGAYSME